MLFTVALVVLVLSSIQASPLEDDYLSMFGDDTVEGMYGDHFEGDIVLTKETRNGFPNKKWPNGRVPYALDPTIDAPARESIVEALREYHGRTCLKWVPHGSEKAYVLFKRPESGCNSPVGTHGGRNTINLGKGCQALSVVLHEMMHTIGFSHEQNRPDRDSYVTILWDNIQDRYKSAFNLAKTSSTFNQPYDFSSVMHYGAKSWSKNGQYTIMPKDGNAAKIKGNGHLSTIDVKKINAMYGCPNFKGNWEPLCKDNHPSCPAYARRGDCQSKAELMKNKCRVSCKHCKPTGTGNTNTNTDPNKKYICEDSSATISCRSGQTIRIRSVYYGRKSSDICKYPSMPNFNCRDSGAAMRLVSQQCNGKRSCTVEASNRFGDSCAGVVKYTEVDFRCV